MNYFQLQIKVNPREQQAIINHLDTIGFEGFEEHDTHMMAYIQANALPGGFMEALIAAFDLDSQDVFLKELEPTNYNAMWEANFDPIIIGDFCAIYADFHHVAHTCRYTIKIDPKMAFGTGHHETTHMMLTAMDTLDFSQKSVFDYGAGTGILAVMAVKMGAQKIVANDIQKEAIENIYDHFKINDIGLEPNVIHGPLEDVPVETVDIILANINQPVLTVSAAGLKSRLKTHGHLLISGVLAERRKDIIDIYLAEGFTFKSEKLKGEWSMLHFTLS